MKKGACSAFFYVKILQLINYLYFNKKDNYELRFLQCTAYKRGLNKDR